MAKRYHAADVARYFLAKQDPDAGDLISNLKLQKLCYYAQGLSLGVRNEPMFNDRLEAWLHGPVVPTLYREYRDNGAQAIAPVRDLNIESFDVADRMILDDVYTHYGQFSGWRLRQMTHDEAPWLDAYERDMNNEITLEAMRAHFSGEVDASYREKYDEVSRGAAN